MGREAWPDLSVKIGRRRRTLVPDADLCLTEPGAALVARLAPHAEICLTPEFLAILEDRMLYDREPELLRPPRLEHRPSKHLLSDHLARDHRADRRDARVAEDARQALRIWARLRDQAGRAGGLLHWVRDTPHESCLPPGLDETVVRRWEAMAEALDARLSRGGESGGPLIAAMRDAAALVAVIAGAAALCRRDPEEATLPPLLCRHLEEWQVPCRHLRGDDELVARDRRALIDLMVDAGLAAFLWGGARLAVVHLLVPGEAALRLGDNLDDEQDFLDDGEHRPMRGAWDGARAFWYDLVTEDADVA